MMISVIGRAYLRLTFTNAVTQVVLDFKRPRKRRRGSPVAAEEGAATSSSKDSDGDSGGGGHRHSVNVLDSHHGHDEDDEQHDLDDDDNVVTLGDMHIVKELQLSNLVGGMIQVFVGRQMICQI